MVLVGLRIGEPAARQHDLRSALQHQHRGFRIGAQGADRRGEATAGLKRHLRDQVPLRITVAGKRIRRFENRLVGGVGVPPPLLWLGGCPTGGPQDVGGLRVGDVGERASRLRRCRHRTHDAQPVFGERAGLVEAHGVHAAQRLDGAGSSNQHTARRQSLSGGELGQGGHQWQALRDGSDSDGDAVGDGLTQRRAAQHRQTRHRGTTGERQRKDLGGQFPQPRLHAGRRLDIDDRRDRAVRGGAHTRGHHDRPGMPGDDRAALEQHAGPFGVGGADRVHLLVDRQRLPGEQGFVDLEVFGHQQTRVGGHHVRGDQVDDVAGTQRAR